MSFGPLTGDSKAIKEDQSISLSHTHFLSQVQLLQEKEFVGLGRRKLFCDYALAWMSLARAFTPIEVKTLTHKKIKDCCYSLSMKP